MRLQWIKCVQIALLILLCVSCDKGFTGIHETDSCITDSKTNEITVTVIIPEPQIPVTRSIEGGGGEAAIHSIDMLLFKSAGYGQPEILTEHVAGHTITTEYTEENSYRVQFKASPTTDADITTVALIANARTTITRVLNGEGANGTAIGEEKQKILSALTYASTLNETTNDWKWNANNGNPPDPNATAGQEYSALPMYGEKAVRGITSGIRIENVELTRMLARIDVINNAPDFALSEIFLVNYNTAGYIAPAWNPADGVIFNESDAANPYINNLNPTLPPIVNPQTGEMNALRYTLAEGATSLKGEIYTYEALPTTGDEGTKGHTDALCLIVKGIYNEQEYYYRIDFTAGADNAGNTPHDAGFNPAAVDYIPVYRNRCYTFMIGQIDGPGYPTFTEALHSLGIMNNLKTGLLVVDEGGITDIVFNGHHYLGLDGPATLNYRAGSTAEILCITNYAYGWELDTDVHSDGIEYITGSGWLSATKENTADKKRAHIQLSTISKNITETLEAYVHVKAGMLRHKLRVIHNNPQFEITTTHIPDEKITPTGQSFGVRVTGEWYSVMVRAWDGTSVVSTSIPSISEGSGTDNSMSIIVPDNSSWSKRTIYLQYSCDEGATWITLSSGEQEGYTVTLSATTVLGKMQGTSVVSVTGFRPLIYLRTRLDNGTVLSNGTAAAASSGRTTSNLHIPATTVSRWISVEWSKDNTNWTRITRFLQSSSIALSFARSNIVFNNNILTFAEDATANTAVTSIVTAENQTVSRRAMPSDIQGVYFKWGSLVAISTTGAYSASKILFSPTGRTAYTWDNIPYLNSSNTTPYNTKTDDDFLKFYGRPGYNAQTGIGDICRYISDRGWVEGRWRMPTGAEIDMLIDERRNLDGAIGYGTNWNYFTVPDAGENKNGFYRMATGKLFGKDATASENKGNPTYGMFMPANGYRENGGTTWVGQNGRFWSSSDAGAEHAYTLRIGKDGAATYQGWLSRSLYAHSVRCIRD